MSVPPHLLVGPLPLAERPDYVLVIPSFNRPVMLRERTLQILLQQGIDLTRVFVFVANCVAPGQSVTERECYVAMLSELGFPAENVVVGVRGIREQRNFMVKWVLERYDELKHVVSMDDDLEKLEYKVRTGFDNNGGERGLLRQLEVGGLEAWIAHAAKGMQMHEAYIWSANTSNNVYFMRSDVISTCNGMCNGYLYGFLARGDADLLPQFKDATEDRERSVRYFAKDGIQLRYKMYSAKTKCFKNTGGLQDLFEGKNLKQKNEARKFEEHTGHMMIENAFPTLYTHQSVRPRKDMQTMEGGFHSVSSRHTLDGVPVSSGLGCDLKPRRRGGGGAETKRRRIRT